MGSSQKESSRFAVKELASISSQLAVKSSQMLVHGSQQIIIVTKTANFFLSTANYLSFHFFNYRSRHEAVNIASEGEDFFD